MEHTGCHQIECVLTHNNNVVKSANPTVRLPGEDQHHALPGLPRAAVHLVRQRLHGFHAGRVADVPGVGDGQHAVEVVDEQHAPLRLLALRRDLLGCPAGRPTDRHEVRARRPDQRAAA
jgi:hypothetical protein